jgi:hypothetical protein
MCQSGATCLPTDCCFSELALKNPTQRVGLDITEILLKVALKHKKSNQNQPSYLEPVKVCISTINFKVPVHIQDNTKEIKQINSNVFVGVSSRKRITRFY